MPKIAYLVFSGAAILGGLFACSSTTTELEPVDEGENDPGSKDAGLDSTPSLDSGFGFVSFLPEQSYSGYDGEHVFKVPVAVYDSADDLKVTAADPTAAEIVPVKLKNTTSPDGVVDVGKYFLVTVKRAGEITLTAESHGTKAETKIKVAQYGTERWQRGKQRYENAGVGTDPACTNCHVNGQAIDHSPAALATVDDGRVGTVIRTGISTGGFPIEIDGKPGHKWQVTDEERDGLITYLRALEPRGFQ